MFGWLRIKSKIKLSAERMGLRDKGEIKKFYNKEKDCWVDLLCPWCGTRVRIGIDDKNKKTAGYCWRCEVHLKKAGNWYEEDNDDDSGGEDEKGPFDPSPYEKIFDRMNN